MSELQDALEAIRERARDAERGRSDDYVKWSQSDVPRLLAAVEAVVGPWSDNHAAGCGDSIKKVIHKHLEAP